MTNRRHVPKYENAISISRSKSLRISTKKKNTKKKKTTKKKEKTTKKKEKKMKSTRKKIGHPTNWTTRRRPTRRIGKVRRNANKAIGRRATGTVAAMFRAFRSPCCSLRPSRKCRSARRRWQS